MEMFISEKPVVYAVSLETVLSGHENWIYSVKWKPKVTKGKTLRQSFIVLQLT